jgi:pSer/pThr/pTyr-binding forkhead associated (FHA) protein
MHSSDVDSESLFRSETPAAQLFGLDGLPQGPAVLVVKRGPNAGSRLLVDQATMTAGRDPNSDIFLDDITVSRRHAQFRCVSGEFKVVDVDSLNGTYVNHKPVSSAVLANGDEVQIGKFRLMFLTGPTTGDTESLTG